MKKNNLYIIFNILILLISSSLFAQLPKESTEQKVQRMQWWTDARFGMFIHWGLYALPARHEWVKKNESLTNEAYQKYFDHFNPDLYNPTEWAKEAKKAGMKYVVITAKHHEGFCLWDTKYTDYKVTNTPYGKDLLKPFVEAFRAEGIKVGLYYSLLDWHHPDFTVDRRHPQYNDSLAMLQNKNRDMRKYALYMRNQITELLTNYGEIACLFLDFSYTGKDGKGNEDWESIELLKLVRKLQPNIIVNDRLDIRDVPGGWDFKTPEQYMPSEWVKHDGKKVPWELCNTFSGSWGYFRDEYSWKSTEQLITMLIEVVSKGGNLLLNVGPTARGYFDYRAVERLQGMGDWMKYNNRSIYGCTQAPDSIKKPENCLLTYNPTTKRLYVHVLVWSNNIIRIPGIKNKAVYAQFLHDASEIKFEGLQKWQMENENNSFENTLELKIPVRKPNTEIPVIEIMLK